MKIFGDLIDDKLFPNKLKRFTSDEYVIIEKIIDLLINKFNGELKHSYKKDLQNNSNYITEEIRKELKIGSNILNLNFEKFYCDKKKVFMEHYYHLFCYEFDKFEINENAPKSLPEKDREDLNKPLFKILTGIRVWGHFNNKPLKIGRNIEGDYQLCVPTRYDNGRLLPKLKEQINKIYLSKILENIASLLNK
jgi:hypothetical protein